MDIEFKCGACGQKLVVDERGAGTFVDCPGCGNQIEIPKPRRSFQKRLVLIGAMICLIVGIIWSAWIFDANKKRQSAIAAERIEVEKLRIEKEESFSLEDAYKPAPASYHETSSKLYGKLIPDIDSKNAKVADSAQSLDEMLAAQNIIRLVKEQVDYAQSKFEESVKDDKGETNEKYIYRVKYSIDVAKKLIPELQKLIQQGNQEYEARMKGLLETKKLFPVEGNTRLIVLDITQHYAKVRALNGDAKGKEFFVHPGMIKVK